MMSKKKELLLRKQGHAAKQPQALELLAQVSPYMEIERIRLLQGIFEVLPDGTSPNEEPLQTRVATRVELKDRLLESKVQFEFRARAPIAGDQPPVVHVVATYLLVYRIRHDVEPSQEALTAFSQINAVYNAWGYWREFLQTALQRLEMPPFTLPLVRVGQVAEWTKATAADAPSPGSPKQRGS